ncbi:hypothetical protein DEO23_11800 [Brachybacterium endophyticum]|uniref:Uncharacterized protein n=1 Tax=Brachybacterium endophyticum TaxID=2182385 RepID=A0A2U2RJ60_9MICO|nr:hypothetical protein [Brachybacterium endophyticum]PWH05871.1 hypothetical protein DEO23_11800 [Brachybacterium endophyticum]
MIGGMPRRLREAELVVRGLFADAGALERAREWARSLLAQRRINPRRRPRRAVRALLAAEPRLTPVTARWLVAHLDRDPRPGEGARPPQLR